MNRYRVMLGRVEYYGKEYIIEAGTEEDAIDKAWDMSGNWQRVEAEEFTNGCELVTDLDVTKYEAKPGDEDSFSNLN
jgi:hypothetical protein